MTSPDDVVAVAFRRARLHGGVWASYLAGKVLGAFFAHWDPWLLTLPLAGSCSSSSTRPAGVSGERDHPQDARRRTNQRAKEDSMNDDFADGTPRRKPRPSGPVMSRRRRSWVEGLSRTRSSTRSSMRSSIVSTRRRSPRAADVVAGRTVPRCVPRKDGVCHTAGDPFHCGMQVLKTSTG